VLFVTRADNEGEGEGGIMALLGLTVHSEANQRRRTVLLMIGITGAGLFVVQSRGSGRIGIYLGPVMAV